jgi:hypothetical protein
VWSGSWLEGDLIRADNRSTAYGWAKLLLLSGLVLVTAVAEASACSPNKNPVAEDTFTNSVAVFRGTITRAEVMKPKNDEERQANEAGIFGIKVYWQIDDVFKGKDLVGKSAVTTTFPCGNVLAVVGQPYIISISPFGGGEKSDPIFNDSIGVLDESGTTAEFLSPERYQMLVNKFKKLRKRN